MTDLPIILEKEPLIDAVFEVRLGGGSQLADIVPGIMFRQSEVKPTLQRQPVAEIPHAIRARDPNLAFVPLIRIDWGSVTIGVGDRNLVIGCKLPYPKWPSFKREILKILSLISEAGVVDPVERYSLKYVNLIPAATVSEQIEKINFSIRLGDEAVTDSHVSLQVQQQHDDTKHIVTVVTNAEGLVLNKTVSGVIVDIDSIREINVSDFATFVKDIDGPLENLRLANKNKFFACLKPETVIEMGPVYG